MRVRGTMLWLVVAASAARAVEPPPPPPDDEQQQLWSLDLPIHDVGIGIGNSRRIDGLRLNYRDSGPFLVHGINVTLWGPHEGASGTVDGLALGLPLTGADEINGIGIGVGLEARSRFRGIGLALLGGGAGDSLSGVFIGGLGLGSGG